MTPHKPVTDKKAEEIYQASQVVTYNIESPERQKINQDVMILGLMKDVDHLLAGRTVAMEIIERLLRNYKADALDYQQPYCAHCHSSWDDEFIKDDRTEESHGEDCIVPKARALLAAVKGE